MASARDSRAALRFRDFRLYLVQRFLANAFDGPASQSIVPHLVPEEHFANAVTWISTFFQAGLILGPALGGWLYAAAGQASLVFLNIAVLRVVAGLLTAMMRTRTGRME